MNLTAGRASWTRIDDRALRAGGVPRRDPAWNRVELGDECTACVARCDRAWGDRLRASTSPIHALHESIVKVGRTRSGICSGCIDAEEELKLAAIQGLINEAPRAERHRLVPVRTHRARAGLSGLGDAVDVKCNDARRSVSDEDGGVPLTVGNVGIVKRAGAVSCYPSEPRNVDVRSPERSDEVAVRRIMRANEKRASTDLMVRAIMCVSRDRRR